MMHPAIEPSPPAPRSDLSAHAQRSAAAYHAGLYGEWFVAREMERAGWSLLGTRVRTGQGELDIVARRHGTVAFVEVKTRRATSAGRLDAISPRSRHRLRRAAVAWLAANPSLVRGAHRYRFDVAFVTRSGRGSVSGVEWYRGAF